MQVQAKVTELKNEAGTLFVKKEYTKAVEAYDQAAKLLPDGAADKAELIYKKAGCLLSLKKWVLQGWCLWHCSS